MNKRLIAIFVCMAVFVLTLVVGSVVFTVSDVNILLVSDGNKSFNKSEILQTSGIKKGQSVFTINKEEVIANIEKQFPDLQVDGVERTIPNKVSIQLRMRTPVFKMKIANSDKYAIFDCVIPDREKKLANGKPCIFKIIDVVDDDDNMYGDYKVVFLSGHEYSGTAENPKGEFISYSEDSNLDYINDILLALNIFDVFDQKISAVFDNFKILSNDSDNYIELQTSLGIKIVVRTNVDYGGGEYNPTISQCSLLFKRFFNDMNGDDREMPNYLFVNNNGVNIGPKLEF